MKRRDSFHRGLVNSAMASRRPNTGLSSCWLLPQLSHSHCSSGGVRGMAARTSKSLMYRSGMRFRAFKSVSET